MIQAIRQGKHACTACLSRNEANSQSCKQHNLTETHTNLTTNTVYIVYLYYMYLQNNTNK